MHPVRDDRCLRQHPRNVERRAPLGKWRAGIVRRPLRLHIGYYATAEEAALAYDDKARELFGEGAYQNLPAARRDAGTDTAADRGERSTGSLPSSPTPQGEPASVALLRTLGALQTLEGGEPIYELDAIYAESGIAETDLWPIIHQGVRAGFVLIDEDDGVSLSEMAWRCWRARYEDG